MLYSKVFRPGLVTYLVLALSFPSSIFSGRAYAEESGGGGEGGASSADVSSPSESGAFAQDILGGAGGATGILSPGVGQFSDGSPSGRGSEYVSGAYKGAVLIPVSILGAVPKPGIHHIPTRTNLLKFLTLAGGPSSNAKLSDVVIKRLKSDDSKEEVKEEIFEINAEDLLTEGGNRGPLLRAGDVVYVPTKKPFIDSNTMQVISVLSAILGIVVTATVLADRRK